MTPLQRRLWRFVTPVGVAVTGVIVGLVWVVRNLKGIG